MFIKLHDCVHNEPVYLNSDEIRRFYKNIKVNEQSVGNAIVELQYGNMIVKEAPEAIMAMLNKE